MQTIELDKKQARIIHVGADLWGLLDCKMHFSYRGEQ